MRTSKKTLKILAPAKVNLFLAVGGPSDGKNSDLAADFANVQAGYHPVLNIMHTVLLHDVLYVTYDPSEKLDINVDFMESRDADAEVQAPQISVEQNIAYKAIEELAKIAKNSKFKISVLIEKNIPHQAGLAGGSTDAAAALVAGSEIFGIDPTSEEVQKVASRLGADVPFFMQGGCALMTGNGSDFCNKLQPVNRDIMIIKPNTLEGQAGLSTADVYAQFDKMPEVFADLSGVDSQFKIPVKHEENGHTHEHMHQVKTNMVAATKALTCADQVPLTNNLAWASEALMPQLGDIRKALQNEFGEENVLLCGSGSATFVLVPQDKDADEIVDEARSKGYWAVATQLANIRARKVPVVKAV